MSRTAVAVVLLALLLTAPLAVPVASAHDAPHGGGNASGPDDHGDDVVPHFEGRVPYGDGSFWGNLSILGTEGADLRSPDLDGSWVVYESRNGSGWDIHALNLATGDLRRITQGGPDDVNPRVSADRVVWIQRDRGGFRGTVMAHDLGNSTSWPLSSSERVGTGPGGLDLEEHLAAWEVHRGSYDLMLHDFRTGETRVVAASSHREASPTLLGTHHLAYLREEYGQWDVILQDLTRDTDPQRVTTDRAEERGLRASDGRLHFLKQGNQWTLRTHVLGEAGTEPTGFASPYQPFYQVRGDDVLHQLSYVDNRTLAFTDTDHGERVQVHEGRLALRPVFAVQDRSVLLVEERPGPDRLLHLRLSPLAGSERPRVLIEEPGLGDLVVNETDVTGRVTRPGAWGDPVEVLVSLDGSGWKRANGTSRFEASLDVRSASVGSHTVYVSAVYPEGPPVFEDVTISVGKLLQLSKDFTPYLETESTSLVNAILGQTALLLLLLLLVVVLALLAVRAYLRWAERRRAPVEYVRPDEVEEVPRGSSSPGDGSG